MSRKELDAFLDYLQQNNISVIHPQALTLKEIKAAARKKGFQVTVEDLKLKIADVQQKDKESLTAFELNWQSRNCQ